MSRIEASRLQIACTAYEPVTLLDLALRQGREAAMHKRLDLLRLIEPGLPERLQGDPVRLGQVLGHLLDNAIKFSEPGGQVTLRVRQEAGDLGVALIRFEIEDQGIGIGPALQDGLFQLFNQGDNSPTRRYGGVGLGLALSRRLVALMSGEIGFSSAPGGGSTFWFRLPMLIDRTSAADAVPAGNER